MSFDFPASPTNGQVFSPTGGPVYVYTSGVWRMQGSGQVVTAEARNRVVNGAMQISQENGDTAGTTNGYWPADQWQIGGAPVAGLVYSTQRVAVTTPSKSLYRLRYTVTTGVATTVAAAVAWTHKIEGVRVADFGWGTASARQIVVRFGFKGPAGTYSASLRNSVANRAYVASFIISAGQANVDTEQVLVVPGDVTGAWTTDTAMGLNFGITLSAGTNYQIAANTWAASGALAVTGQTDGTATTGRVFEIFDVGLYLDPNATGVPPPWQMPDEAAEYLACQRYYQKLYLIWSGNASLSTTYTGIAATKANTRVQPTVVGTPSAVAGFPNTAGTPSYGGWSSGYGNQITEGRICNLAGPCVFSTFWEVNARM